MTRVNSVDQATNRFSSLIQKTCLLVMVSALISCVEKTPFTFVEATIDDVHAALQSGDVSCAEIVTGYLARIEAYDKIKGVNAIIFDNPNALNRAREIDRALNAGEVLGSLYCVPVLLKDNFDTADMPTSGGSIALKNSMPPDDAFVVKKLRDAGAIVIAKTNMAEWAFSAKQTLSSSYGRTANAYDVSRVPAGSSGGTASGIAASFGVIGMGSDTGNSIRGPSSHLGLFGIRSTLGLVSRDGVIPLAFDRDVAGPMTRTVTDAAKVLSVIAGRDDADSYTAYRPARQNVDYTDFLDSSALKGKRIGILRALVNPKESDPEIVEVFNRAVTELESAGAIMVDNFEISNLEDHMNASNFCVRFRYDMGQYLKSLGEGAPIKDVMEVMESGQYDPYIEQRIHFFGGNPKDIHPKDLSPPCPDFADHKGRQAYLQDVVTSMNAAALGSGVDAFIYPSWSHPPAHIDSAIEEYLGDNSQNIAPATGLPAVTVPMGVSHGNLPAGLQIVGRPDSDGILIGFAYAYEQHTRYRKAPLGYPPL
ncbi:MAG: Asp-tRNA(Asn)/Glu-tRNA(Gln) amidotransferase A subunit family amidase [Candidatus Azotimanducaceae bacterium]|jgi:Asp-tRNA(Asn)/Glu-tRNA(Gln) amidotransferase A subunit family amidase